MLHAVKTTPGFCRAEENRLKLGFLRGSWNKMRECDKVLPWRMAFIVSWFLNLWQTTNPTKRFLGKRWIPVRGSPPKCSLWNLQSLGMLNENSIPWFPFRGAVSLPVLGYTRLAQAGMWWCPSRAFPNTNCAPFFLPWGLPGEGRIHWDFISWCQISRRVFTRNPPHPCVHHVASCWCLVLNT